MLIVKKLILPILFFLGISTAFAGAASDKPTTKAPAQTAPTMTLMFFINPNGAPCQAQEKIINEFRSQIEKRAKILAISTESFSAPMQFRKFGIRYLPALVLVDANQQEIKRFAPGIQSGEQILKELADVKVASTQ